MNKFHRAHNTNAEIAMSSCKIAAIITYAYDGLIQRVSVASGYTLGDLSLDTRKNNMLSRRPN